MEQGRKSAGGRGIDFSSASVALRLRANNLKASVNGESDRRQREQRPIRAARDRILGSLIGDSGTDWLGQGHDVITPSSVFVSSRSFDAINIIIGGVNNWATEACPLPPMATLLLLLLGGLHLRQGHRRCHPKNPDASLNISGRHSFPPSPPPSLETPSISRESPQRVKHPRSIPEASRPPPFRSFPRESSTLSFQSFRLRNCLVYVVNDLRRQLPAAH